LRRDRFTEQQREIATVRRRRLRSGRPKYRGSRGRASRTLSGPNHNGRLHGDRCFEPLTKIREVRQELRHDQWLALDIHPREHRCGARRQGVHERVDAMALAIGRAGEAMHHHQPTGRDHVREVALHRARRDALAQLVFGVELVAGHRQVVSVRVTASEIAGAACRRARSVV
jgi:hypothetical protein